MDTFSLPKSKKGGRNVDKLKTPEIVVSCPEVEHNMPNLKPMQDSQLLHAKWKRTKSSGVKTEDAMEPANGKTGTSANKRTVVVKKQKPPGWKPGRRLARQLKQRNAGS
ncbi:unnamed protein product [Diplocarpon coronariae]